MANSPALGVPAAGPWARISALLIDASLLGRALGVAHALRLTIRRNSYEFWETGARWLILDHLAESVRTTGRWLTGVYRDIWYWA